MKEMKKPFEYYIFIQIGSAFEDKKKVGISHFLEHMVFDHSLFKNRNGIDDFLTENNIYDSAEVSKFFTFASFSPLNKKNLKEIRKRVKQLIKDPNFTEKGVNRQRRIILEESAYYKDLPFDILDDEFCKTAFTGTGLEHSILGDDSSLKSLTLEDLQEWHSQYYVDSNIVEVIFNREEGTMDIIAPDNFSKPFVFELNESSNSRKVNHGFSSKGLALGWYLENLSKKQRIILDIVRNIIGASPQSFIYRKLTEELNLIYESTLYLDHLNGISILTPQLFSTQPDKLLEEFNKFKKQTIKEGISDKAFQLAKQSEEHYFSLPEDNMPYTIGEELMKTGELVMPKERLEILKNIEKEDVEDLMKELFNSGEFQVIVS